MDVGEKEEKETEVKEAVYNHSLTQSPSTSDDANVDVES